ERKRRLRHRASCLRAGGRPDRVVGFGRGVARQRRRPARLSGVLRGGAVATGLDTEKANEVLDESFAALERFGSQRVRNLGVVAGILVAFSIWAIATDGFRLFFQRTVDALNNGFIYAAMALSLVLIYKATGVVNFAQGNMAMFGTFIAYVFISDHGFPVWLGIVIAMILSALGGAAIERLTIRPFDPSNHLAIVIVTLAWFLILGALATVIWGAD